MQTTHVVALQNAGPTERSSVNASSDMHIRFVIRRNSLMFISWKYSFLIIAIHPPAGSLLDFSCRSLARSRIRSAPARECVRSAVWVQPAASSPSGGADSPVVVVVVVVVGVVVGGGGSSSSSSSSSNNNNNSSRRSYVE
jgi:hypothetical protein